MIIRRSAAFASLVFVPVFVLVSGCTKNNPPTPATPAAPATPTAQTCTCIYPFATQCDSACNLTEYVVQSAGPNQVIGRAVQANNKQAAEDRVIPTSKLSAMQMQQLKPGSRIQVITRMENGKPVITSLHVVSGPAAK